ncbi:MAG TPA: SulP family inorganic anion transporter [Polyangiales bacterium]|nr:SulP family inorganic anion transporter [Polyangiales bacterium]
MTSSQPRDPPESLFPTALTSHASEPARETLVERLFPFVRTLRDYKGAHLRPDLIAGLTVALFTLPQGMAYALIAGFPPAAGLSTAIVASILGAAFGSSEFLVNGPTNAISVMLAAHAVLLGAQGDPVAAVVLLTLMIGVVQLAAGYVQLGTLTRFVSEPVLIGFTSGAGVYIVINQLPSFLGIERSALVKDLWGFVPPKAAVFDMLRVLRSLDGLQWTTAGLAALTLVIVRVVQRIEPRIGRRLPGPFIAIVLVTFGVWFWGLDRSAAVKVVRNIQPLSRDLLNIQLPHIEFERVRSLIGPALAIGLMGAVEAIAVGKTLAARAGHRFDASRQLVGEGFCNLGAALVGGFASSGSFSRTAVNYEAGAVTRISCIASGVLVLVLVLLFAPIANWIPIAALAGTLVHIGLKLVDVGRLKVMFETTTGDRTVLLTTFAAVLFVEHLETALLIGIAVSVYYALRRAEGFKLRVLSMGADGQLRESAERAEPPAGAITVLNLGGELFFAAAEELQAELLRRFDQHGRVIVLRVQEAYNLDVTTAQAIVHVAREARKRGGRLLLCGVRPGMYGTFERAGLIPELGEDALFRADREILGSTRRAVRYAQELTADPTRR